MRSSCIQTGDGCSGSLCEYLVLLWLYDLTDEQDMELHDGLAALPVLL